MRRRMRREDRRGGAPPPWLPGPAPTHNPSSSRFPFSWGLANPAETTNPHAWRAPAYVGGTIAFGSSWRLVAGSLSLPAVIASVLLLVERLPRGVPKSPAGPGGARRALASRPYRLILLVYMFAGFAYQGGLTFLPRFIGSGFFAAALGLGGLGPGFSRTPSDRPRPPPAPVAVHAAAAA